MPEIIDKYRLMSITEASKAFKICREELTKCFHRGLKYQKVGTRKKVCWQWWIDYMESENNNQPKSKPKKSKKSGMFKMDKSTRESIYSL